MANDAFFTAARPFTKRKREDGPNASRTGTAGRRGTPRGSSRGGSARGGASRGGSTGRGGASSRGGAGRGGRSEGGDRKGKARANEVDEELDVADGMNGGFDSSDDEEGVNGKDGDEDFEEEEDEEDDNETPAQKRLRLSQMYLKSLEKDVRLGAHKRIVSLSIVD